MSSVNVMTRGNKFKTLASQLSQHSERKTLRSQKLPPNLPGFIQSSELFQGAVSRGEEQTA